MAKLKAYLVRDAYEGFTQLIFAETASKARYFAASRSFYCDLDYVDSRARRFPAADVALREGADKPYWEDDEKICGALGMKYSCFDCEAVYPVGGSCPNGC